jgi:octaprenyl-diphosphate synthase
LKLARVVSHNQSNERQPQDFWAEILSFLSEDLAEVERLLDHRLGETLALIQNVGGNLVSAGGKRIRPIVLILAARACGYQGPRAINLATCLEFIHTATLLHDDVVDESPTRRGKATSWTKWGNKASILVGDFLFSRAFECMVEDGELRVLKALSEAATKISQGEIQQLMHMHDLSLSEAIYEEIIDAKTASLFAAASGIGAILGGASAPEQEALERYGQLLGHLFQITDDVMDYYGDAKSSGKKTGVDFHEGKVTLPILRAYAKGNAAEKAFWSHTFVDGHRDEAAFEHAKNILSVHNIKQEIQEQIEKIADEARTQLKILKDTEARALLDNLLTFSYVRAF